MDVVEVAERDGEETRGGAEVVGSIWMGASMGGGGCCFVRSVFDEGVNVSIAYSSAMLAQTPCHMLT